MLNLVAEKTCEGPRKQKKDIWFGKYKDKRRVVNRDVCFPFYLFIYFMVKPWVPERTHHGTVWARIWPRTDILKTQQFRCPKAIETAG
jgi:hypothetical protein